MVARTARTLVVAASALLTRAVAELPPNAAPGVKFVGSQVCAGCHKAIYEAYRRAPMGRSLAVVDAAMAEQLVKAPVRIEDTVGGRIWETFRQDGTLYQSQTGVEGGAVSFRTHHQLMYAVGSGVNGVSFIVRRGNHLFQAPLSFYSRSNKWGLSPGYEAVDHGFSRPIHSACISCHSGKPRPDGKRTGLYADPPFDELSIGCENCHGPGQLHVSSQGKQRTRAPDKTIVNPKRLPPRVAEDICANCHQAGDTRVLQPGKEQGDFRPGMRLADVVAIFNLAAPTSPDEDILQHHSGMQLSRCFEASTGTLSCLTCHNPHRVSIRPTSASYRSKCLSCHIESSCALPVQQRREQADDCIACHMPKRPVTGISHSALTNHRIVRMPGQPLPDRKPALRPDLPGLVYWNRPTTDGPISPLVRLRAYGELLDRAPELKASYLKTLKEAQEKFPSYPDVLAAVGRKALLDMNPESAKILRSAIEAGSTAPTTFFDLGEALSRQGKLDDAIAALKQGIELEPYSKNLRKSLILRYIAAKDYASARAAMTEYLDIFPEDVFMRNLLRKAARPSSR